MSISLRRHKRRACAGMARRFARIPREPGTEIHWTHYTRAEWRSLHGDPGPGVALWCRWLDWTWGRRQCDVQPRSLMERGFR